jgi:hypothetical protein
MGGLFKDSVHTAKKSASVSSFISRTGLIHTVCTFLCLAFRENALFLSTSLVSMHSVIYAQFLSREIVSAPYKITIERLLLPL